MFTSFMLVVDEKAASEDSTLMLLGLLMVESAC
jgi:hypothetical protein